MGSLSSRPKIPVQPQYVPVYYPPPVESLPDTPDVPAEPDNEAIARQRAASLLDRSRGVLSTVVTGFRGVLSQTNTQQRKTLLGE